MSRTSVKEAKTEVCRWHRHLDCFDGTRHLPRAMTVPVPRRLAHAKKNESKRIKALERGLSRK